MSVHIRVAHDFVCPWCWIGLFQAQMLAREFGAKIEWVGYELYPDELELPEKAASSNEKPANNKPKTPTRMELAYAAANMDKPTSERIAQRTHNAHEVIELAKTKALADRCIEILYRAHWEQSEDISDPDTLVRLTRGLLDEEEVREVMANRTFAKNIVGFDDAAYASGVYNVPTFFIGGERYAEQPYRVLARAIQESMQTTG